VKNDPVSGPLPEGALDLTRWTDLASRRLAGSVVAANDELFAERENLVRPEPSSAVPGFGNKGKLYDGWETRRRRSEGNDWAVVRLGAPGVVHAVVVDTASFRGNYPPEISVEAACVEGYPSVDDLLASGWRPLVPRSAAAGDTRNLYAVDDPYRCTHVRLSIYPDGGVARFRVHGEVVADPAFLRGTVDLLAAENGGRLLDCSDAFYSSPVSLIQPGRAAVMGDGWENARRRHGGNDHATFALAGSGVLHHVEVDTSCFVGNAPGWGRLTGGDAASAPGADGALPVPVVDRTALLPDTRHRFLAASGAPVERLRLDVYPDGGLSRLRAWGELTPDGLAALEERRRATTPPG
jgi:allantoicase